jgi:uncharacterized OB-fold protein
MTDLAAKPLPEIDSVTQPFWAAAAAAPLATQQCKACSSFVWTPRPSCSECGSSDLVWTTLSGRGSIYSFTIVRRVIGRKSKAFEPELPYSIIWVDLLEGPRLISNLVGCSIDAIEIGKPVRVVFESVSMEIKLPKFTLVR